MRSGPSVLVSAAFAALLACSPARPPASGAAAPTRSEVTAGWPESWAAEFGLRCAAAGEDVRVCACIANEVQKRWTPEQFTSLGPDALREHVAVCRDRVGGAGAK